MVVLEQQQKLTSTTNSTTSTSTTNDVKDVKDENQQDNEQLQPVKTQTYKKTLRDSTHEGTPATITKYTFEYRVTETEFNDHFKTVPNNEVAKDMLLFTVEKTEYVHDVTLELIDKSSFITVHFTNVVNTLNALGLAKNDQKFEETPKYASQEFLHVLPKLENQIKNFYSGFDVNSLLLKICLKKLYKYLKMEYNNLTQKIERMVSENKINFDSLWFIFQKESKFVGFEEGEPIGSEVVNTYYQKTMFSSRFNVEGKIIQTDGRKFQFSNKVFSIHQFNGVVSIDKLNLRPMNEDMEKELQARGKIFERVGLNNHYMSYKGNLFRKHTTYTNFFKATGRVQIDENSFKRMNPDYLTVKGGQQVFGSSYGMGLGTNQVDQGFKDIPEDKLYMCSAFVRGFAFSTKMWGELAVSGLSEVIYDEKAFTRLVLPAETKTLIKSLVEHVDDTYSDFITNKGGGVVILLHGPPGIGKTLTSEAVSEFLHRPLYSISVGELGVSPETLEKRLTEILEVASTWKSVILIDEADIFLEKRNENNIQRNSMIGIFLRLLEYHQGIIFLTTNRVKDFDEAFHSRISIAIKYKELDRDARKEVWSNFFEHTQIEDMDLDELSKYDLNGRNIRNLIRLSQSLALSEKSKTVKMDHIRRCIKLMLKFNEELKE